jgi:serine/threonine protein kinase
MPAMRCERGHSFEATLRPTDREVPCPECGSSVRLFNADATIITPGSGSRQAHAQPVLNDLPPGTPLGRGEYLIHSLIRTGGMGQVFKARQKSLARDVAIKVLLPDVAKDHGLAARFFNEARILASIEHPHIVRVHGMSEEAGLHYIVMELVLGPGGTPTTLASRIEALGVGGRFSLAEVTTYACQALDAIQRVHDANIIHRDIKPSNFLIDAQGNLKLTDFGLATGGRGLSGDRTLAGTIMGTEAYMAPEQRQNAGEVLHYADLYSMGCVIYDLLAGTQAAIRMARISEMRPEVPPAVDDVIRKAVEQEPRMRFHSAAEMKSAFVAAMASSQKEEARHKSSVVKAGDDTIIVPPPQETPGRQLTPDSQSIPPKQPAPSTPAPRPKSSKKRDGIIILGRAGAGKTMYLTALYARLKAGLAGRSGKLQVIPYDQATEQYCSDNVASVRRGSWPLGNTESKLLEFSVNDDETSLRLVTLDPKGEAFEKAFHPMHQHDKDVKCLVDQLDRAAGLILLSDARQVVKDRANDDWLFWKSICRVAGDDNADPVPIPVALVLTKYDVNAELIEKAGGLRAFCAKRYPQLLSRIPDLAVFSVSACGQTVRNGQTSPADRPTEGISRPFEYVIDAIKGPPPDRVMRWLIVALLLTLICGIIAYRQFMPELKPLPTPGEAVQEPLPASEPSPEPSPSEETGP